MLSGIFVVSGSRNLRNPGRLGGRRTGDRPGRPVLEKATRIPTDTETLIRLNAAVQVGGGLMLATGRLTRPAALVLAGTLVPTTLAGHPFWNNDDPAPADNNQIHFLKNLGLVRRAAARRGWTPRAGRACAGGPGIASATLDARCSAPSARSRPRRPAWPRIARAAASPARRRLTCRR